MRVEHAIIHTGQHYDPMLSDVFFRDLGIPEPDLHLGVGSGSHGLQTGTMLSGLEKAFVDLQPDWVVVYGDTNSTVAAALGAVKLNLPVAHLEAGLRSFNRRMPEEHNRVLTDHAADLLLAPTEVAVDHLAREGLAARTVLVGDIMADELLAMRDRVQDLPSVLMEQMGLARGQYYLATIHRAENTDDAARLASIVSALADLDKPVVLLAHPRTVARSVEHGISLTTGSLVEHPPLAYPHLVAAIMASAGVITDSGGLQKEAFLLRVQCTTLRRETEWVETVDLGWNVLANTAEAVRAAVQRPFPAPTVATPYGDGCTARRVLDTLMTWRGPVC